MVQAIVIPLRLLDCLGFAMPSPFTDVAFCVLEVVDGLLGAGLGVGLGVVDAGLLKKAEGEGMLMVAMSGDAVALCVARHTEMQTQILKD